MNDLSEMKCVACRGGEPTVAANEIREYSTKIPNWSLIQINGVDRLEYTFRFNNFIESLAFTNLVGNAAEEEDHHPALLTEWGRVTVSWWTHKIKGLHKNDFIMAAKTDKIFSEFRDSGTS